MVRAGLEPATFGFQVRCPKYSATLPPSINLLKVKKKPEHFPLRVTSIYTSASLLIRKPGNPGHIFRHCFKIHLFSLPAKMLMRSAQKLQWRWYVTSRHVTYHTDAAHIAICARSLRHWSVCRWRNRLNACLWGIVHCLFVLFLAKIWRKLKDLEITGEQKGHKSELSQDNLGSK